MQNAAFAYLKANVNTTSQGELLVMLYDAAIKFLKQAKEKMAVKDYAGKGILISKAIDIIAELSGSLNKEKGGEIAQNLTQLYFFCQTRLLQANLKMDPTKLDEVVTILDGLRSAYAEILETKEVKQMQAEAKPLATQASAPTPAFTPVMPQGMAAPRPKINPYAKAGGAPQAKPEQTPAPSPQAETQAKEKQAPTAEAAKPETPKPQAAPQAKPGGAFTLDMAKAKAAAAAKKADSGGKPPMQRGRAAQAYANQG